MCHPPPCSPLHFSKQEKYFNIAYSDLYRTNGELKIVKMTFVHPIYYYWSIGLKFALALGTYNKDAAALRRP